MGSNRPVYTGLPSYLSVLVCLCMPLSSSSIAATASGTSGFFHPHFCPITNKQRFLQVLRQALAPVVVGKNIRVQGGCLGVGAGNVKELHNRISPLSTKLRVTLSNEKVGWKYCMS